MKVTMESIPEAGGLIAIHDDHMQTSIPGVFVAGDSSGIEEASTAMIEGKIAGIAAAIHTGKAEKKDAKVLLKQFTEELNRLRAGPFGEKPRIAKQKIESFRREKK
jgi:thioredoxin reductase